MPDVFCLPLREGFCQPSRRIQIPPSSLLSPVYFFSQSALFFLCKMIVKADNREEIGEKNKLFQSMRESIFICCVFIYIHLYMMCKNNKSIFLYIKIYTSTFTMCGDIDSIVQDFHENKMVKWSSPS